MLQMIVVGVLLIAGLFVFAKGELRATSTRVVRGGTARLLGATFCLLAALPIVLDPFTGTIVAIGIFVTASIAAIATASPAPKPTEQSPVVGPSLGAQLVGEACAMCSVKLLTENEGGPCRRCGKPVHHDCLRAHKKAAHRKAVRKATEVEDRPVSDE